MLAAQSDLVLMVDLLSTCTLVEACHLQQVAPSLAVKTDRFLLEPGAYRYEKDSPAQSELEGPGSFLVCVSKVQTATRTMHAGRAILVTVVTLGGLYVVSI